jgi:hypothetical protein
MEYIFWGGEMMKLESVALLEPKVIEWRDTLQRAVQTSLIPLKAYAEGKIRISRILLLHLFVLAYETYAPVMNLNIDHYIKFVDDE